MANAAFSQHSNMIIAVFIKTCNKHNSKLRENQSLITHIQQAKFYPSIMVMWYVACACNTYFECALKIIG